MKFVSPLGRVPLIALAALSLLAALWAGLVRLGWALPPLSTSLPAQHGPLMISGFLGTLISLERAVALGQREGRYRLAYLAPLLSGLGALISLSSLPLYMSRGLAVFGALGLTLTFLIIYRLQPDAAHGAMGVGALLWLAGSGLWLYGWPVSHVVQWWAGFLVLTIAGERLELARVLLVGRAPRVTFFLSVSAFLAGLLIGFFALDVGLRVSGAALTALGLWLLFFDIARRTIRQTGLTRFIAACLLPGYTWLALSGLLWLVFGGQYTAGPVYDAMLHSLFLGFVFSMIFGHAPIIIPGILRIAIPYRPYFYLPLVLLHVSLIARLIGDFAFNPGLRQWGGLFNAVAVLLFLTSSARAARS